jgi:outer membrane receptor protein involved in Fe transport
MDLRIRGRFRRAIPFAFGGIAASLNPSLSSWAADQPATQELKGVEVTGSRIRRVDTETSNTVEILDRRQILATGAATLGDLIQAIPANTGASFNSEFNAVTAVGGVTDYGSAEVTLRGLESKRTLVLLDGQRLNNTDINSIPINIVERVEVLKEGAAAIYGSDAIGGVINFISRKNFEGLEISGGYGETQQKDGGANDVELTWGSASSRGHTVFGAAYSRQREIAASSRQASSAPLGFDFGQISPNAWSSTWTPQGRFFVPNSGCPDGVTLTQGAGGTSAADYRCFVNNFGPGPSDRFNYQTYNFALDPSQHLSLFGSGEERVTDDIRWFARGFYTESRSSNQEAPAPFDNSTIQSLFPSDTPTISKDSLYNPFGSDITTFFKRATDAGPRVTSAKLDIYQFTTGLKGTLLDKFQWDVNYNWGRTNGSNSHTGFLDFSNIEAMLGPSFIDSSGTPTCGTPSSPIAHSQCTPLDIMGSTGANLSLIAATANELTTYDEQDLSANITGDILEAPAGPVGLAMGTELRYLHYSYTPDALEQAFRLSENNSLPTNGGYNVRELYAETHVPLFADLPAAKLFAVTIGARAEGYSSFGNHASGKYAFEWRPYGDLLVRGTYADVYRAPRTDELYLGAVQGAPFYADPCAAPDAAASPNFAVACKNVPADGSFQQLNFQANADYTGNPQLRPETGYSTDFGLVFSPSFYKPASFTADLWTYSVKHAIEPLGIQTILDDCFTTGAVYCGNAPDGQPYIQRNSSGTIVNSQLPFVNADDFLTSGIDLGLKLDYRSVTIAGIGVGRIDFGVDLTYLIKYHFYTVDPGTGATLHDDSLAGQYDPLVTAPLGASYPRVRMLSFLFWEKGPYKVSLQDRFMSNLRESAVDDEDAAVYGQCDTPGIYGTVTDISYDAGGVPVVCYRQVGYVNYVDIAGTYTVSSLNTDFTGGVNDLFDDGAQQMYNGGLGGAANPQYDIRGRNFYARVTVRFK